MITIITTLLMIIGIIASITYMIYILSVESDRIKKTKELKILSLSMAALSFIIFLLKLFNADTSNSFIWLFNTSIWLFNYYLNDKTLKNYQKQTPEWEWLRYQNKNNNFNKIEKKEISKDNIWTKFVEWLKEK